MRDVETIKEERKRLRNDLFKCEVRKRELIDYVMSRYGSFKEAPEYEKYVVAYLSESIITINAQIEALTFTLNEDSIIPDALNNFKWNRQGITKEIVFGGEKYNDN